MKVLITGAGGFLGQYIAEMLVKRGDTVRNLSRGKYPQLEPLGIEQISGDLRDAEAVRTACKGQEAVIHTAAIAGIGGRWNDYFAINTQGTYNILSACQSLGIPKLVYCSSPSVTFAGKPQSNVDESAPYPSTWLCHYPRSKALAEQAVLQANGQQGVATCALRPHLIWGPRDQHLIPRLISRAKSGQLRQVGDGTNLIDATYVENAALAHVNALDQLTLASPAAGQAYFISQGEPVNCWNWINELLALAHLPPVKRSISFRAAYAAGAILEGVHWLLRNPAEPRMTRFLAAQLATDHYFNIPKAREDLGYAPQISMAEGMRRLAQSWQNQSP